MIYITLFLSFLNFLQKTQNFENSLPTISQVLMQTTSTEQVKRSHNVFIMFAHLQSPQPNKHALQQEQDDATTWLIQDNYNK